MVFGFQLESCALVSANVGRGLFHCLWIFFAFSALLNLDKNSIRCRHVMDIVDYYMYCSDETALVADACIALDIFVIR